MLCVMLSDIRGSLMPCGTYRTNNMNKPLIVVEQVLGDPDTPDAVWDSETGKIQPFTPSDDIRLCKRCGLRKPVDEFRRRISINKALSLARASAARKGMSSEPLKAEAYHRNMTAVHAMCNACALKRRTRANAKNTATIKAIQTRHTTTVKQLTAEEYDTELQLDGRFEHQTPNPYGTTPRYITLRESMVEEYKRILNARRAEATRRAKKANAVPSYKAFTKEIYNEMQRIKMMAKTEWCAGNEEVGIFFKHYLLHLEQTRETIRKERYAANPVKPKANVFKYFDYDSEATKRARLHLRNLTNMELDRIKPRLLPTADLYD